MSISWLKACCGASHDGLCVPLEDLSKPRSARKLISTEIDIEVRACLRIWSYIQDLHQIACTAVQEARRTRTSVAVAAARLAMPSVPRPDSPARPAAVSPERGVPPLLAARPARPASVSPRVADASLHTRFNCQHLKTEVVQTAGLQQH